MKSRDERLVENELLFRKVNERIVELGDQPGDEFKIVCECASEDCTQLVVLRADEYLRVRKHPDRFIVLPGHEVASLEDVVENSGGHLVVEKHSELLEAVGAP
jgi:UV DNA damage repair endonuclease